MPKIRIGLIGTGWMGGEHGRNVAKNPDAEITAVSTQSKEEVDKLKKETGKDFASYSDYRVILDRKDIDAVIISTPNRFHAEMCIAGAKAGKHIYCEKPMAINYEDCKKIRLAVKKANVKYMIGYHRRFNPIVQYVKNLIDKGDFGKPFFIESDYIHYIPAHWSIWEWLGKENIAGSIFHAGCGHNIDLVRFFAGEIAEVTCYKDIFHPRKIQVETEDTAIATLKFKNGMLGKVMLGLGAIVPFTFNFAMYGTKGTVKNNKIWLDSIPKFDLVGHENDYIELPESWIPTTQHGSVSEPWDKAIDCFIDIIKNNKPSPNDVDSAYKTSEACFAIIKSAEENKNIKLPL